MAQEKSKQLGEAKDSAESFYLWEKMERQFENEFGITGDWSRLPKRQEVTAAGDVFENVEEE